MKIKACDVMPGDILELEDSKLVVIHKDGWVNSSSPHMKITFFKMGPELNVETRSSACAYEYTKVGKLKNLPIIAIEEDDVDWIEKEESIYKQAKKYFFEKITWPPINYYGIAVFESLWRAFLNGNQYKNMEYLRLDNIKRDINMWVKHYQEAGDFIKEQEKDV